MSKDGYPRIEFHKPHNDIVFAVAGIGETIRFNENGAIEVKENDVWKDCESIDELKRYYHEWLEARKRMI